jgi:hypothetical protein
MVTFFSSIMMIILMGPCHRSSVFLSVLTNFLQCYVVCYIFFIYVVLDIFMCVPISYLVSFLHIIYCSMFDLLVK